jgi:hypothetical protein
MTSTNGSYLSTLRSLVWKLCCPISEISKPQF